MALAEGELERRCKAAIKGLFDELIRDGMDDTREFLFATVMLSGFSYAYLLGAMSAQGASKEDVESVSRALDQILSAQFQDMRRE